MNRQAKAAPAGPTKLLLAAAACAAAILLTGALAFAASAPTVSKTFVSNVGSSEATLNAEVDFGGAESTQCKFLYGPTESYGAEANCARIAQSATVSISATAGQFRLSRGAQSTADLPFDASAGQLKTALAAILGPVEALTVSGGPGDETASSPYKVSFQAAPPYKPLEVKDGTTPLSGGSGASLSQAASAKLTLSGLEPDSTYHYRALVANAEGPGEGVDRWFHTYPSGRADEGCPNAGYPGVGFLPNCRAWEMVSPPDKNGIDVTPITLKQHVSADGEAVSFSALGTFSNPKGSGFATQYVSRRGAGRWSTLPINPLGGSITLNALFHSAGVGNAPIYLNAYAPDLSAAIFQSWRPLTPGSNTAEVANLYRVDGLAAGDPTPSLLSGGEESLTPVNPAWREEAKLRDSPALIGASTDLSHVAFQSTLNLTADAAPQTNPFCEGSDEFNIPPFGFGCSPRVYNSVNGVPHLVSRIPAGGEAFCDDQNGPACEAPEVAEAAISPTGSYSERTMSADGSRILFKSGDILYLREDNQRTYKLGTPSRAPEASRDLSRVFFTTEEALLPADTDTIRDLYMYEVEKPASERLTLISASEAGAIFGTEVVLGASEDGRYVYFEGSGHLTASEPFRSHGIYLWHDGDLSYIGEFPDIGEPAQNSAEASWPAVCCVKTSRVSPDGRHLLFMTSSDQGFAGRGGFPGYDQNGQYEFYLYDADTGRLQCASCNPTGAPPPGQRGDGPWLDSIDYGATSASTSHQNAALSSDGRYVFFTTPESLLPEDTNGAKDAYEFDAATGKVHLLSSGTSSANSYFMDASADGKTVFIDTRERLSGWDTDGAYDLYAARIDGGLPEPTPVPAPCEGESCLPSPGAPPPPPSAASKAAGAGNPKAPCPKGRRKVRRAGKARCVKQRARHHKQRGTQAKQGGSR